MYDSPEMARILALTRVTTSSDGAARKSEAPSLSGDGTKIAFDSDSEFLGQVITDNQYEVWLWEYLPRLYLPVVVSSGS